MQYFKYLHPSTKLVYLLSLMIVIGLTLNPIVQIIAIVLLYIANKIADKKTKQNYSYFIYFTFFMVVINVLFNHRGRIILFYIKDYAFTLEGILYAVLSSVSLISILMAFNLLSKCISNAELLCLFSKKFPKVSMLFNITLNFVRLFTKRSYEIQTILKTKNIDIFTGSIKKRIKDGIAILNVVISFSLENSVVTAKSISARFYGDGKRTNLNSYKFRFDDLAFLFVLMVVLVAIFFVNTSVVFEVYPQLKVSYSMPNLFLLSILLMFLFCMQFFKKRGYK